MSMHFTHYTLIILFLCTFKVSTAQISDGGFPFSAQQNNIEIPTLKINSPAHAKLMAEDENNAWGNRVAAPLKINADLNNAGKWTDLDKNARLWTLGIHSKNAKALALQLDNFYIPVGAKLFFYNEDRSQILGAYTDKVNNPKQVFFAGILKGEKIIIEYFEPSEVKGQGKFRIFNVLHVYKEEGLEALSPIEDQGRDFGDSAAGCHININCPEASAMQVQKNAVCRIIMVLEEGMGYCTGSLMNNSSEDAKPYVLSAFHCQSEYTPMYEFYRFDFNYEGTSCTDPSNEPSFNSITGCSAIAGYADTDFQLFELSSNVPLSFAPYFLGWNKDIAYEPLGSNLIHHPAGDIKKYSHEFSETRIFNNTVTWDNDLITTPQSHFRVKLDVGAYEGGSSGGPLLDNSGYVVGQLHGGTALCDQAIGFCGRLAKSWEGGGTPDTRLKDWLDPLNEDATQIEGFDPTSISGQTVTVDGTVALENGLPFEGVSVNLVSETNPNEFTVLQTVESDANGQYVFENVLTGGDYVIAAELEGCHRNGITTFDLILISQHILGVAEFSTPEAYIKADVNGSGTITTFDIIQARQLILEQIAELPQNSAYYFMNDEFTFAVGSSNVFENAPTGNPFIINLLFLSEDTTVPNFIALKVADVNGSATACP